MSRVPKREPESDEEYAPDGDIKRQKLGEASMSKSTEPTAKQRNDDGEVYWELGRNKRVTVRTFKGQTLVDFREYYEKDGKKLPGKKGLSLTTENFKKFCEFFEDIKEEAKK